MGRGLSPGNGAFGGGKRTGPDKMFSARPFVLVGVYRLRELLQLSSINRDAA